MRRITSSSAGSLAALKSIAKLQRDRLGKPAEAVKTLAREADVVLVVGSQNSSNSQRLKELALECDVAAYLIDSATDIQPEWFQGDETVVTIREDARHGPARLVPKPLRDVGLKWRNTETLRRLAYLAERR